MFRFEDLQIWQRAAESLFLVLGSWFNKARRTKHLRFNQVLVLKTGIMPNVENR